MELITIEENLNRLIETAKRVTYPKAVVVVKQCLELLDKCKMYMQDLKQFEAEFKDAKHALCFNIIQLEEILGDFSPSIAKVNRDRVQFIKLTSYLKDLVKKDKTNIDNLCYLNFCLTLKDRAKEPNFELSADEREYVDMIISRTKFRGV